MESSVVFFRKIYNIISKQSLVLTRIIFEKPLILSLELFVINVYMNFFKFSNKFLKSYFASSIKIVIKLTQNSNYCYIGMFWLPIYILKLLIIIFTV